MEVIKRYIGNVKRTKIMYGRLMSQAGAAVGNRVVLSVLKRMKAKLKIFYLNTSKIGPSPPTKEYGIPTKIIIKEDFVIYG